MCFQSKPYPYWTETKLDAAFTLAAFDAYGAKADEDLRQRSVFFGIVLAIFYVFCSSSNEARWRLSHSDKLVFVLGWAPRLGVRWIACKRRSLPIAPASDSI